MNPGRIARGLSLLIVGLVVAMLPLRVPALVINEPVLAGITISGPASLNEGASGAYILNASYDNGTTATVTGLLTLAATSYATLSGATLTAGTVNADQTVVLNASYTENGITRTASKSVTVVFGDTQAPTVPASLTANAISTTQVNLAWNASTDNVGVTAYQVFRGGVFRATVNAPTTSYSDTGLAASTLYSYTVAACDAAGNCSAPSTSAAATTLAAGIESFTPVLKRGWNLLGNSLDATLNVESVFGSLANLISGVTADVNSVWKWNATVGGWQFYAPNLSAADNQTYADANGFAVLASIEPGMGYWVNIKNTAPVAGLTLAAQNGEPVIYEAANGTTGTPARIAGRNLVTGWQLVAIADARTPSQFNEDLSGTVPQPFVVKLSFQSLWAWDAAQGAWYFYAPQLEKDGVAVNQGLTLVQQYATNNGFLHFEDFSKTLGVGVGFWIRK